MPADTAPALAAALLLVVAGAQKVIDPTMTVGALRALRLPSSEALVRAGSLGELGLGVAAAVTGERVLWVAVAASYGAFAVFVIAAMSRGTMIGSCGCFGRDETPPHLLHVVLDAALATVAIVAAVRATSPIDAIVDEPGAGAVVSGLVALTLYLLYLAFVELPRLLVARAPHVH